MYYETATNDHGLPHDPLKALVAPRPIGWISSLDANGQPNLAPYSFFNLLSTHPAIVGFSSATLKDSQRNIEETGDFVCNFASVNLIDEVNTTSKHVAADVDEFELSGLHQAPSKLIKAPRVKEARAHLECEYLQTLTLPHDEGGMVWSLVLGRVLAVHIDDRYIKEGLVDTLAMEPLTRMGYMDYGVLGGVETRNRP
ncbi:flavin reductase family protein [Congregibacter litoralis]|uniref:Conserved protein/domain protein typically associated with flavoprotein oxygenase, DIM6/NTAB family n=1 Tax=Congregibacter litoralis KT71 TaxID=314285 RepID=A4AE16_9GAMM|nr:flavin reductase family protein [Congregibacter litoralis]EAQ95764.1 Conserved protein/domain protein typically associated with flavoprotein oxygenase, DIM6/NTAB family [Congregibacter litoralis KT71]